MKNDVFLSYKREDEKLVQKVREALLLRGVTSIWMDRHFLKAGHDWEKEIYDAIGHCQILILFGCRDAFASEVVTKEYTWAHEHQKTIIPLLLEDLPDMEIPDIVKKYNWLKLPRAVIESSAPIYTDFMAQLAERLPRHKYTVPEMMCIPSGEATIGKPDHTLSVNLPEFWLGKTVVTVNEYACFIQARGYETEQYWLSGTLDKWLAGPRDIIWPHPQLADFALKYPTQPMRGISWYEAMAYCNWLSLVTNHPFTLPSEAQWEKAARGSDGRRWSWGNEWQSHRTDVNDTEAELDPLTTWPKDCGVLDGESPYGCQDMMGQVWEWTLSVDLPLPYYADNCGETLDDLGEPRIIRGGSWRHGRSKTYAFHRESQMPVIQAPPRSSDLSSYAYEVGFRLATMFPIGSEHDALPH